MKVLNLYAGLGGNRFYDTVGPAFFMVLGAVLGMFPSNFKAPPTSEQDRH